MSMKNPLTPAGIEPATFRFVVQRLNHCATAVPLFEGYIEVKFFYALHVQNYLHRLQIKLKMTHVILSTIFQSVICL